MKTRIKYSSWKHLNFSFRNINISFALLPRQTPHAQRNYVCFSLEFFFAHYLSWRKISALRATRIQAFVIQKTPKKENYANKCGCVLLTQRWRLNMSLLYFSFYGVLFLFECVRHHWGNEHRAIFGIWINLSFKSSGKRFSLIALLNGTKWKSYAATKSEYLFWYSENPHLSLSRTILYRSRYFRVSLCVHYHFTHSVLSWKLAKKTHQTTNNRKTEKKNQF